MLPLCALQGGRLDGLGTTRHFRHGLLTVAIIVVIVSAVADTAQAQIYSWRDAAGRLVLSNRPKDPNALTVGVGRSGAVRTTASLRPRTAGRYDALIEHHAAAVGVRPDLVRAVIQVESAYNPRAVSSVGAQGLMQLMPATADELGVTDPFDPDQNIRGGVTYLHQLLDRYDGNEELALAAYNAGPGAVARYGNQIPPYREIQQFLGRIRRQTEVTTVSGAASGIYKSFDVVGDRRVPRYSNVRPPDRDQQAAERPRPTP